LYSEIRVPLSAQKSLIYRGKNKISYLLPHVSQVVDFDDKHNALLRCEQRNTNAAAYQLNHLNQRIVKMPRVANHS
ncbi:hypothetical protein, partial [Vibrio harveyi]|uniref:hypothetical protein n=1 Tax=Vibrio harveyi TaxID=669 RepID=UPI00390A42F2